ncbi:MAG: hypothetical protein WD342_14140 [Verrucomicrobiales bacterium]
MKNSAHRAFGIARCVALCVALSGFLPVVTRGYDAPNFDYRVFSADGIFLPEDQQKSILDALVSLASDFPGVSRVDSDIKEKALALALALDPLHGGAREAHRALKNQKVPKPTDRYDTLAAVSEALWTGTERLLADPVEPEAAKLAPYLIELSLLTHPEPPPERFAAFVETTGKQALPWEKFTTLQPDNNPSTARSQSLVREMRDFKMPDDVPDAPSGAREKDDQPALSRPEMSKGDPDTSFEPVSRTMNCLLFSETGNGEPVAGRLTLELRPPESAERDSLPSPSDEPDGDRPLPLLQTEDGVSLTGLEVSAAVAAENSWQWPADIVGEVSFETDGSLPPSPETTLAGATIPVMILIESALKDLPIVEEIILAGNAGTPDPSPDGTTAEGKAAVLATLEAAARLEKPFLALPESALARIVDYLHASEQLGILFPTEILSYADFGEAVALTTREVPASLSESSRRFSEIEAVSARMPLVDLARNAKVQERLASILDTSPQHLSARAMLEFGRGPAAGESESEEALADRIDAAVEPFVQLAGDDFDVNEMRNQLDDSQLVLSRMRMEATPEIRDYHSLAEDFLEACERFLELTNQTTSIAEQRLREARNALSDMEAERSSMGLEPLE